MRGRRPGLIVVAVDELRPPLTERLPVRWRLFPDVLLAVLLAAASAAEIAVSHRASPAAFGWTVVRYLAVAAACGAVPLRRRFATPVLGVVAVAVALLNVLGGYGGGLITGGGGLAVRAVPLAVYGVAAASASPGTAVRIGAAVAAIEVGALFAVGGPEWGTALLVLALAAAGWLAGENTRSRRAHLESVLERAAEREREHEQQARQAGAEERLRIARELHDVVAHAMSIIAVRSGVARLVIDVRPDEAREALGIIEGTSRQALAELRLLVGVLRGHERQDADADREPAPGLADLPGLIGRINEAGVSVGLRVEGEPRRLSPGADLISREPGRCLATSDAAVSSSRTMRRRRSSSPSGEPSMPPDSLSAAEPLDGFLGDRGEEVDEVAVGIAEQDGPVSPGHRGRLLYPFADEGLQPLVLAVHVIDEELDDHGVVVRGASRVVEQLGRLRVAEGDGAGRQVQLSEDGRGADSRDACDLLVELNQRLEIVGDHADRCEVHSVPLPSPRPAS
jgi:signal transduction histidine kinase